MTADFSGSMFGQYEIQDFLDDNGIIQSYKAYQTNLKRSVAVHVLNPEQRGDSNWRKALVTGAEIAARYAHPNITPVIDSATHENVDYVVVRLMEGGTLLRRMEKGPLTIPEAVSIIKQIGAALDYVHSRGSCHGDPASVNIIFDAVGNAFVADFYLMGFLQSTTMELNVGVPAFMAPERLYMRPPSDRTDQYALAGVGYNMLTGHFPWKLAPQARFTETMTLPQTYRPKLPAAVSDVLRRAMAIEPADRYPTIMDFARQFEVALQATPKHVFISYSHKDTDYAQKIKNYLHQNAVQVWIDEQIEQGDKWFNKINEAIESCAAFLVIMSPDAEQSEWTQKEILLAKRYKKPIFPLLLSGREFPLLIDIQFVDVRDGDLPPSDFYRRMSRTIYGG